MSAANITFRWAMHARSSVRDGTQNTAMYLRTISVCCKGSPTVVSAQPLRTLDLRAELPCSYSHFDTT